MGLRAMLVQYIGSGLRILDRFERDVIVITTEDGREWRPIVCCCDCIYYEQDPDPIDPGWPMMCEYTGQDMLEPYGFCAWGSRKEVE